MFLRRAEKTEYFYRKQLTFSGIVVKYLSICKDYAETKQAEQS